MLNLDDLNKEIKKLNKYLDGITDNLVSALETYQSEYENLLLKESFDIKDGKLKATQKNFNKAQSLSPARQLGFNEIATAHIVQYDDIAKNQLAFNKSIGIKPDLKYRDITILNQLKEIDYSVFQAEALLLDERIKRELVNAIALEMPYKDTVDNLATSMLRSRDGKTRALAAFANTYMRTAAFGLSRAIDQEVYDKFGGTEQDSLYLYSGPVDSITREFCIDHVGKVYSREKIEQFPAETGSPLNPFTAPAGFNCRHTLILIIRDEAEKAGFEIIE